MIQCGTAGQAAKKGGRSGGYGKSIDWWALGILVYEMVMGYPPFFGKNPFAVYTSILEGKVNFKYPAPLPSDKPSEGNARPVKIAGATKSFIQALLTQVRTEVAFQNDS